MQVSLLNIYISFCSVFVVGCKNKLCYMLSSFNISRVVLYQKKKSYLPTDVGEWRTSYNVF